MPLFSNLVDLRNFVRGRRLGYQTVNRIFANVHDELVPLILLKRANDGKVLGREHARLNGFYARNGGTGNYDLQGQNPDYPYLAAVLTPLSTGRVPVSFTQSIGTSDYTIVLTAWGEASGYVHAIGIDTVAGARTDTGFVVKMWEPGPATPVAMQGFDVAVFY